MFITYFRILSEGTLMLLTGIPTFLSWTLCHLAVAGRDRGSVFCTWGLQSGHGKGWCVSSAWCEPCPVVHVGAGLRSLLRWPLLLTHSLLWSLVLAALSTGSLMAGLWAPSGNLCWCLPTGVCPSTLLTVSSISWRFQEDPGEVECTTLSFCGHSKFFLRN